MLKSTSFLIGFLAVFSLHAQVGWNWPEDADLLKQAKEKQAYYKVQMQLDNYEGAFNSLQWLYEYAPDLNPSIYIDGAKVIDEIMAGDLPGERKGNLEDSLLWTYDMRMKYFDEKKASVMDRKAFAAFKLYYRVPARYPLLAKLYADLFSYPALDISDFNLTPYMTLTAYYHKSDPDAMSAGSVLDIHQRISEVIEKKIAVGQDQTKLQKEQDKIDAFLSSLGNILSCQFIEEQLVPKFDQNTEDLSAAKKIFAYSLKAKCSDQPYFVRAGETLFKSEPSYTLADALADRFYSAEQFDKSLEYYEKAEALGQNKNQQFEALMGQALTQSRLGNKTKSRSLAYEALSLVPNAKEAFNLIGNLYYTSYNDCRKGESRVMDRGVFLAAYEMYEKAGNSEQMRASQEQFPSIEEIFTENMEEGQKITINCWINESVTLRRRPSDQ